jgi:predicted O-methyltransferase YrrM
MDKLATYESIIELIIEEIHGIDNQLNKDTMNWNEFIRFSDLIHDSFIIPSTTISPVMRRFLYMIARCKQPVTIVAAGVYTGYALSWMVGGAGIQAPGKKKFILGIDTDENALTVCRNNYSTIGLTDGVFEKQRAQDYVYKANKPIDMLFIDIDDPISGKVDYENVLKNFYPFLADGAYVLAHDSNERKFKTDFQPYHRYVYNTKLFSYSAVLPLDSCGITLTIK